MIWQDIAIDRRVSHDDVTQALASVFGVPAASIYVVAERQFVDASQEVIEQAAVVCIVQEGQGEFPEQLEIIINSPRLKHLISDCGDLPLMQALVDALAVAAIVDDGSANPYRWLLLQPGQPAVPALLDADALDDHNAFVLARDAAIIK